MPSSVASVAQQVRGGGPAGERIEMDPQFAVMLGLGLTEGTQVSRWSADSSAGLSQLTSAFYRSLSSYYETYQSLHQSASLLSQPTTGRFSCARSSSARDGLADRLPTYRKLTPSSWRPICSVKRELSEKA